MRLFGKIFKHSVETYRFNIFCDFKKCLTSRQPFVSSWGVSFCNFSSKLKSIKNQRTSTLALLKMHYVLKKDGVKECSQQGGETVH